MEMAAKSRTRAGEAEQRPGELRGLCVAGGGQDPLACARRMVEAMGGFGEVGGTAQISRDIAVGWVTGGAAHDDPAAAQPDGPHVFVHGSIFTARERPAREVILALLRAGDCGRIAELNGTFCAVIGEPERGEIILAADRLGTRPLYYWSGSQGFAAATRLPALLADTRVPRRLKRSTLYELTSYFRSFGASTQYTDIRCLQGAQLVTMKVGGEATVRRTGRLSWRAPDFRQSEGVERLAHAARGAIRRVLHGAQKPALLLSGGFDSRFVLAAASAEGLSLDCISIGAYENPEIATARRCAEAAGQNFTFIEVPPMSLSAALDAASRDCDGLYIAPTNFHGVLPRLAEEHDLITSGHGLDYTLRAMYLPRRLLHLGRSRTVFPRLSAIPDGQAETVSKRQYVATGEPTLSTIVPQERLAELKASQIGAIEAALAGAEIDDPYDAWDACLLHNQARHYAYSDFVALDRFVEHRTLAFDAEVLDLYFSMPPAWRASGDIARRSLARLSPVLASLPNANTSVAAGRSLMYQTGAVLARAGMRRLGLTSRPRPIDPTMTLGSWANKAELLRRDPVLVERLHALTGDALLFDTGAFSRNGVRRLVEDHLARRANHSKLLGMLLTLQSWFTQFPYSELAADD